MQDLTTVNPVYDFHGHNVRVIMRDGEPWFVAKDVCAILQISKYRDVVAGLDDDERGICPVKTLGGEQGMSVISESGLYALIMRSRKPSARAFRKWVTSEVLPSIRKQYVQDLIERGMGLITAQPKVEGYFYIFDFGHIIKVGMSQKSPEGRLQSHVHDLKKMGLPHAVKNELVVSLYNFMELETAIKRRYSAFATTEGGEWMRGVTFETLVAFTEGFKSNKGE